MFRYFKIAIFFLVFVSIESFSAKLDLAQLKQFSDIILKETQVSPQKIFKYLSDDLEVERQRGSNVQGVTLFCDKAEFIELTNKSLDEIKKSQKDQEIDIFDFKIKSSNKGEFTISTYSNTTRRKMWSEFTVELINNKILITKIIDSA
jgi:hypothetical protein